MFRDVQPHQLVLDLLTRLGFGESELTQFVQKVAQADILSDMSVHDHVAILAHESHEGTWYTTEGLPHPTATHIGSKPGDPLGDIIFNMTEAVVLTAIDREMLACSIGVELPPL